MALANFTQVNGTISIDEMLDRSGTNWNVVKKPLVTEEGLEKIQDIILLL